MKDALPQVGKAGVSTAGCTASEIAAGCVEYSSAAIVNNYDEGTGRLDWDISPIRSGSRLVSYVNNLVQPSGDTPGNVLSMLPFATWQYTFAEKMQYFNETMNDTWTISHTIGQRCLGLLDANGRTQRLGRADCRQKALLLVKLHQCN